MNRRDALKTIVACAVLPLLPELSAPDPAPEYVVGVDFAGGMESSLVVFVVTEGEPPISSPYRYMGTPILHRERLS